MVVARINNSVFDRIIAQQPLKHTLDSLRSLGACDSAAQSAGERLTTFTVCYNVVARINNSAVS
jgi:hypothetical protein